MTYVYCLVRSTRKPVLRRSLAGLPGTGEPRVLDAGRGLWLIAAGVDESDYSETAIAAGLKDFNWVSRRAIGHEAIVDQFLAAPALLPMQLFTIFASDERALGHVRRHRRRIDRILKRIEGQLEWGLRLTWDEAAARATLETAQRISRRGGDRGAVYLARKRDLLDVNRIALTAARADATRLYRDLSKHATEARRRTSTEQAAPGSRLLLDAAYLVPAKRTGTFRAALRKSARRVRVSGIAVSLTGPWPPYNFIASRAGRGGGSSRRGKDLSRRSRSGEGKDPSRRSPSGEGG